jgi:hypothetical protein
MRWPAMTREQRQALRESLIAQGFDRSGFTNDLEGTGQYREYWINGDAGHETIVEIRWGARV